ncbi:phage protease [Micromonospora sp. NPDC049081]|uniref:phage protease n=1 Tax=Micromonospora sp. NPDC049081 TaxID=3155150 RepID=UPI0033E73F99
MQGLPPPHHRRRGLMDTQFARREGVELIRTGTWNISTGKWTANRLDLNAAVAAMSCPAIQRPIVKIGHTDKRFTPGDGEPAIGWYENLRTTDGGHTLVGDQVAPQWISNVQAAAWPNRSVEGTYNYRCGLGHTHPFVLTAVALLGVTPPGVSTLASLNSLDDVRALYGMAASARQPGVGEVRIAASVSAAGDDEHSLKHYWTKTAEGLGKWRDKPHPWTALYHHLRKHVGDERAKRIASEWFHDVFGYWPGSKQHRGVKAATDGDDMPNPEPSLTERIHTAWNASNPPQQQWIVEAAPDEVIVMDNTDRSLMRFPVTVDGDSIVFGDGERVRPAYVPAGEPVAASRMVFASADESRPTPAPTAVPPVTPLHSLPADRGTTTEASPGVLEPTPTEPAPAPTPEPPAAEPETAPSTDPKGADPVSTLSTDVRSRLGLTDDATEQDMLTAIDALKSKANTADTVAASAAEADDLRKEVQVLASQVQTMSTKLAASEAEKVATVKATVLDAAVKQGKIAPADREQWERDYDDAPAAITRVLASIAAGTAVPVAASGYTGADDTAGKDQIDVEYERLFGAEKAGA